MRFVVKETCRNRKGEREKGEDEEEEKKEEEEEEEEAAHGMRVLTRAKWR